MRFPEEIAREAILSELTPDMAEAGLFRRLGLVGYLLLGMNLMSHE